MLSVAFRRFFFRVGVMNVRQVGSLISNRQFTASLERFPL